jgi:hypothetical protein
VKSDGRRRPGSSRHAIGHRALSIDFYEAAGQQLSDGGRQHPVIGVEIRRIGAKGRRQLLDIGELRLR